MIKMDIEDIILVLINKTGKTRYEIMDLIEKKQIESGGTISHGACANLVARDLNVDIDEITTSQPKKIKDLLHMSPGSSNVSIKAFIKRVYHFTSFIHDNNENFVQNLLISDDSGTIRLTLWGSMVKLMADLRLKKGDEIQIIRGVIKNGRFGERELHLNDNSSIKHIINQLENSGVFVWQDVLFPGSLSHEHTQSREIDLQGIITSVFNVEQEKRPSFITLVDPESTNFDNPIKINFWNDRKAELLSIDVGNKVLLEGVSLKENYQNQLEVNFNRNSNLTVLSQGSEKLKQLLLESPYISSQPYSRKIVDRNLGTIKSKETFNVVAKVFSLGKIITFNKKDGTEGKVLRIGIFDAYGSIFLVLWDSKVELAKDLSINDIIYISGGYLRENKGNFEINLSNQGSISKRTENVNFNIPDKIPDLPINKLTKQWTSISLYGEITSINETKTFNRNDGSTGKVKTIQIADNTGEIKIVAWNETIKQLEKLKLGDVVFIENLSLRLNKFGEFESHLNKSSEIQVNDFEMLPNRVKNISFKLPTYHEMEGNEYRRIRLDELTDELKNDIASSDKDVNDQIEFRASIINIGESPLYYKACPSCAKKVDPLSGDVGICPNHSEVEFVPKLLFRVILDDGSKTFYATMIGNIAEKVTGLKSYHVKKLLDGLDDNNETALFQAIKSRIIGNEYFIKGKISTRTVDTDNSEKIFWDLKINYIALANPTLEMKILEMEILKN